jgi:hypothetical protein
LADARNDLHSLNTLSESHGAVNHTTGENVDILQKFERAIRTRHHLLKTELAKIEGLIKALDKNGTSRVAKRVGRKKMSAAARRRISMAQKARWAKAAKA